MFWLIIASCWAGIFISASNVNSSSLSPSDISLDIISVKSTNCKEHAQAQKEDVIKLSTWLKHPLLETIVIGTHLKVIKPPPVIVAVNQIIPWSIAYSNKHNRKREITAESNKCIRFLFRKLRTSCFVRICIWIALVWLRILLPV